VDTYSGRRRVTYEKARLEFERRGVKPSDAKIRGFLKIEAVKKPGAVPRIIQPRNPRCPVYGLSLGRFIKVYEPAFKDVLKTVAGYPVILKGYDPRTRARVLRGHWERFGDPVAISMDASRFDQHVSITALQWEHRQWMRFCPSHLRSELRTLLDMQLRNDCTASADGGFVKYKTEGCRMSGDMNTSAGNCLLMSSMLLALQYDLGVDFRIVNDGDDSLLIMDRRDSSLVAGVIQPWFRDMGFKMEVEPLIDIFEKIDFCQCRPVVTAAGWVMVRNPEAAMAKDLSTFRNFPDRKSELDWLDAVGTCGIALTDGVPVYQSFYRMFLQPGREYSTIEALQDRGFYQMAKGMKYVGLPITDEARHSYWLAFGVTPQEQVQLETHYAQFRLSDFPLSDSRVIPYSAAIDC
jgi:hypothetical protein